MARSYSSVPGVSVPIKSADGPPVGSVVRPEKNVTSSSW